MLSIFSFVSGPSVYLPWRTVCSSPLPIFLIGLLVFLEWNCVSSLYIWVIKPLSEVSLANMFSHMIGSLLILMLFSFFSEAFYFDEVPFVYSFLYVSCFRGCVCEHVAAWNVLRSSCQCFPQGLLWCYNLYLSLLSILSLFSCMA